METINKWLVCVRERERDRERCVVCSLTQWRGTLSPEEPRDPSPTGLQGSLLFPSFLHSPLPADRRVLDKERERCYCVVSPAI